MKKHLDLICIALAAAVLAAPVQAEAQAYPSKPIRVIVPTAPGGGVDSLTRVVAQKLTEFWGQQVVVDNRGGASGIIGTGLAAGAAPDGYTLLVVPTTFSVNPSLFRKLPYDPHGFVPVSLLSKEPNALVVHPSLPVKSVQDLLALARRDPGALNYGFGGNGSSASLSAALLKLKTGIKAVGISYKGAGPAVTGLVAGETQFMFVGLPPTLPLVKAGKLRPLAVTARARSPFLPEVPTMDEAGVPDFEVTNWIGVLAPPHTPAGIVRQINAEIVKALGSAAVRERFGFYGVTPHATTPQEFRSFLEAEIARWRDVVKAAHMRTR